VKEKKKENRLIHILIPRAVFYSTSSFSMHALFAFYLKTTKMQTIFGVCISVRHTDPHKQLATVIVSA